MFTNQFIYTKISFLHSFIFYWSRSCFGESDYKQLFQDRMVPSSYWYWLLLPKDLKSKFLSTCRDRSHYLVFVCSWIRNISRSTTKKKLIQTGQSSITQTHFVYLYAHVCDLLMTNTHLNPFSFCHQLINTHKF